MERCYRVWRPQGVSGRIFETPIFRAPIIDNPVIENPVIDNPIDTLSRSHGLPNDHVFASAVSVRGVIVSPSSLALLISDRVFGGRKGFHVSIVHQMIEVSGKNSISYAGQRIPYAPPTHWLNVSIFGSNGAVFCA